MDERRSSFTVASRPFAHSNARTATGESTSTQRNVSSTANANDALAALIVHSSELELVEFANGFEEWRATERISSNTFVEN
jgi:hypothetical protein